MLDLLSIREKCQTVYRLQIQNLFPDGNNIIKSTVKCRGETHHRYIYIKLIAGHQTKTLKTKTLYEVVVVVLLFLTFSVLVANPKKLLYTVANPARGLLNREKRTKEKVWQHTPPPHPPHCSSEKINKIKSRDASTGATQVVGLASVQGYLRLVD